MSTGIFSIGMSGMAAAQIGLLTTEHNITNANTPGYNRQRIGQASNIALSTGAGFIGQGAHVDTVARVYNNFLQSQIYSAQTTASELNTYTSQIKQIDNLLADASAGLTPALQEFFTGVQQVAAHPASIPSRQAFVSSAQTLAVRFQTLEARFTEMYEGVNEQLASTTGLINTYAEQIAKLNARIVVAQAATNQPPNDLLDQRDQLIADLNKEVKVATVAEDDGSLSVFIGTGQQLVVGQHANQLEARPSSADGERFAINLKIGGAYQELPESMVTGGNLAGFLRFRSESLDKAANALGQIAVSIANVFNAQQSLGQNLLGQTAADSGFADKIFLFDSANVPKILVNNQNTGSGSISPTPATAIGQTDGFLSPTMAAGSFSTQTTSSDYELAFSVAGAYTVKRLSDGVQVASGTGTGTVTFDGVSIDIGAVGANGDRFVIQPTREAARNLRVNPLLASDPRLLAAAAPVRSGIGLNSVTGLPNSGNGVISAPTVDPAYTLPAATIQLTYNAATQEFSGFPSGPDPRPYSAGGTSFSFDGISFTISGTPADGDRFTIEANTGGISDSRNAVLMGKLQTQNTMLGDTSAIGGKASFQGVYAQLVSYVGNKTREVQVTAAAQESLLEQAQASRDAQSGVNLDEEAANLLRYQYAYQAAAKMLQTGTRLFDTILSIAG